MERTEQLEELLTGIGYGKVTLSIDGEKCTAVVEKWKRNPTRSDIDDAVGNAVLYEFGGIEIHQGNCTVLKQIRKIRI